MNEQNCILKRRSRQRGQGLVEMGIVVLLMVTLCAGIVEFGRMLMILNIITNATRDATRAASAINPVDRCQSNGQIKTAAVTAIKSMVTNQVGGYVPIGANDVTVTYNTPAGSARMVVVRTAVPVPWIMLFNLVGTNLNVNRTITFRDEFTIGTDTGC